MSADTAPSSCPRTGRTRSAGLPPGATRPSDLLTVFLVVGVAWMLAAAACGAAYALGGPFELRWIALHFAFVGGISQLIIGAAQFFACAFLATEPPNGKAVRAELIAWNVATVCIAVGVPNDLVPLTGAGGALLLVGLLLFDAQLRGMRQRSIQRIPWATRWYRTAALLLGCGALLGPVMAGNVIWTHGSLLGAHLALNIGGWFGTAIVGTLHTFYPSLTGTRLRLPRLQAPTHASWSAGIVLIAISAAFASQPTAIAGWALLLTAVVMLGANLLASAIEGQLRSAAAWIVSVAQLLLGVAVLLGLTGSAHDGPVAILLGPQRDTLVLTLLAGWVGLTVVGSLLHLLALMARVRRLPSPPPTGRFRDLPAIAGTALVLAGIAVLLAESSADSLGHALLAAGYLVILARVALLAWSALRAAPLGMRTASP